jgi:hypothetical protein
VSLVQPGSPVGERDGRFPARREGDGEIRYIRKTAYERQVTKENVLAASEDQIDRSGETPGSADSALTSDHTETVDVSEDTWRPEFSLVSTRLSAGGAVRNVKDSRSRWVMKNPAV